ncbi:DNA-directed DNA polymerase [Tanacetum coccineum]
MSHVLIANGIAGDCLRGYLGCQRCQYYASRRTGKRVLDEFTLVRGESELGGKGTSKRRRQETYDGVKISQLKETLRRFGIAMASGFTSDVVDLIRQAPHHGVKKWLLYYIFYDNMSLIDHERLDQFVHFHFSSLNEEEELDCIEEYVRCQDDSWDDPPLPKNIIFILEIIKPTLEGQLRKAYEKISYLPRPIWVKNLRNPYLIYDICGGAHEADECNQNGPHKQIHVNLPFLEAMIHMPKGSKVLKDLLSHKEKLEKLASLVKLSEECSAVSQRSLPQKEGDLGSFTLPCLIGLVVVKNALDDLGAIYENLLVKINKFIFPVDFMVLEMDEDELVPIILGRPFLVIARAVIDVHEGKLSLRVGKEIVNTVDQDGKWVDADEECQLEETRAVSFYPKQEKIDLLEWKALENHLKPSITEPPKLELKELPEHLKYAFLKGEVQLLMVISFSLSA